jgi:hypothetical protein
LHFLLKNKKDLSVKQKFSKSNQYNEFGVQAINNYIQKLPINLNFGKLRELSVLLFIAFHFVIFKKI